MTAMKSISVIGIGLSPQDLTPKYREIIHAADVLVGGKRHLSFFEDFPALKKEINKDLTGLAEYLKNRNGKNVVVIASGDPLFYGIGAFLVKSLGAENVVIYPNITTVAGAFARIKESWHDAQVLSLHGRDSEKELAEAIAEKDKIAVFTDSDKNPAWVANFILKKGAKEEFQVWVFEQLGSPDEKIASYTPEQAASLSFSEPNFVILRRVAFPKECKLLYNGMPDKCYLHHKGNITKPEVRAVSLSKLKLFSSDYVLWDLGAGSGSVSIEASLFLKTGKIIAVEHKAERIEQIRANGRQFGIRNLEVVEAALPDGLDKLPKPDRIFIGGGGKELGAIIDTAARHLKPGGIMVINTVLVQSLVLALESLKRNGFNADFVQIQISRGQKMPWGERTEAQNPVWIISGEKEHL